MFQSTSVCFRTINIVFLFVFVTSTFFLNGVDGKVILMKTQPPIDASLLTSKIVASRTIIVDVNGPEKYKSIQGVIDSIPDGNPNWVVIHVKKGIYREKVKIPMDKPNIFLRGSGRSKTTIVWSQSSENNFESATFKVEAPHFIAFGISFKNDAPTGIINTSHNQSVAAYVGGDMAAFYNCGFYSTHNTLLDNKGRHYYDQCYFQGAVDVIFGRARSIFHDCEVFVIADKRIEIQGSVMAHTRNSLDENTGFVFINGKVFGIGHAYLGRPKGDNSRVIFANTYMSKSVRPAGWTDWHHSGDIKNLYHAEYNCHGPGSATNERARWLRKPSDKEVAPFLSANFIDGKKWLMAGRV